MKKPPTVLLLVICLVAQVAVGASPDRVEIPFPGYPETRVIRSLKKKADRLYEEGKYGRAHIYYTKRLAFYGDKYSQYMAGFQYLHGLGVPQNLPRAFAWYRLAAQRGNPILIRTRDELADGLSATERQAADAYFKEIDGVYGDLRILERLIFSNLRELRSMTGSRIGATIGPLKIIRADGTVTEGTRFYDAIERRMEIRVKLVELLRGRVDYGELTVIEPGETQPTAPADEATQPEEISTGQ